MAWLQIIKPDNLVKQEDMRSLREVAIDAPRGMIVDREGRPLAVSVPVGPSGPIPNSAGKGDRL